MKFILGKKIGMTRIFDKTGKSIPVTVVDVGPCFISQIKTAERDGYHALQIAYDTKKYLNKPQKGHLKLLYTSNPAEKNKNFKILREIIVNKDEIAKYKVGDLVKLENFAVGDKVTVKAVSKGKGFQGTVKRHHFNTGPKTHGSDNYRQPGSIGATYPQRTIKGRRMSGHMGHKNVTIKNIIICDVFPEKNQILLKGSVPGNKGALLYIKG